MSQTLNLDFVQDPNLVHSSCCNLPSRNRTLKIPSYSPQNSPNTSQVSKNIFLHQWVPKGGRWRKKMFKKRCVFQSIKQWWVCLYLIPPILLVLPLLLAQFHISVLTPLTGHRNVLKFSLASAQFCVSVQTLWAQSAKTCLLLCVTMLYIGFFRKKYITNNRNKI
jgi:hypothetical protein